MFPNNYEVYLTENCTKTLKIVKLCQLTLIIVLFIIVICLITL